MPDKRKHRGANPQDSKLFSGDNISALRQATADYSLLLTKDYPQNAALKLVGDKFELTDRQRLAVMRSSCSDRRLAARLAKQLRPQELAGQKIIIDGYNVLITVEAAKSGAFLFIGRDGCIRDLAGMHGTYRKVAETIPAIELINNCLKELKLNQILWLLDRPVSNSGRLKKIIETVTGGTVRLINNPDTELIKSDAAAASSDSAVLDGAKRWFSLAAYIIGETALPAKIIDLSD
ncbi:MAG: DUF434 domain-containing protein [Planctomycetes bacterium HGW-Planctomycetes-1]|nr:MAG: DUF434 domain-containing protein [Planctomycetes bacterium HGW-Planctomycetes-1]